MEQTLKNHAEIAAGLSAEPLCRESIAEACDVDRDKPDVKQQSLAKKEKNDEKKKKNVDNLRDDLMLLPRHSAHTTGHFCFIYPPYHRYHFWYSTLFLSFQIVSNFISFLFFKFHSPRLMDLLEFKLLEFEGKKCAEISITVPSKGFLRLQVSAGSLSGIWKFAAVSQSVMFQ